MARAAARLFAAAIAATFSAMAWAHGASCNFEPAPGSAGAMLKPEARDDPAMLQRHLQLTERARKGNASVVFLGDSITQAWSSRGKSAWAELLGQQAAVNLGLSGDRVEHLAWRVVHGALGTLSPRVIVLMIGTNNLPTREPKRVALGIRSLVGLLRCERPEAKILLLGLLPRGPIFREDGRVTSAQRLNAQVNAINDDLSRWANGQDVVFLDIGSRFEHKGEVSAELMPDGLHLSAEGYRVWAQAMQPTLRRMLVH